MDKWIPILLNGFYFDIQIVPYLASEILLKLISASFGHVVTFF